MRPFWIIWSPTGTTPPKVRFTDRDAAVNEAERLAGANPGQEFIVLLTVARSVKRAVHTDFFNPPADDGAPF